MADPAPIEAIQAATAEDAWLILRMQAVQHVLALLDPRPDDAHVGYIALLQRAHNALTKELKYLGMEQYGIL